jgi:hypothetical protein
MIYEAGKKRNRGTETYHYNWELSYIIYKYIYAYIYTYMHIYIYIYIHTHNGLLLNHKEWNSVICSQMDRIGGHYIKWNTEKQVSHILSHVWKLEKNQSKCGIVISRD